MIGPINQQNYENQAGKIMSDLFDVSNTLKGTGVDITPIVKIMQITYSNYIVPKELERYEMDAKRKRLN